jgi:anaerobic magnesium-protoporphyrin IX monomethyl ester cyclase
MKIQLVVPPRDRTSNIDEFWLPMGLIAVGTLLKKKRYDVEILNGEFLSIDDILDKLDCDLLGMNPTVISMKSMSIIAKKAKEKGIPVVLGGQGVTPIAKQILSKNKDVDYIIVYDGIDGMFELVKRIQNKEEIDETIPNLAFRKKNFIFIPKEVHLENINFLYPLDLSINGLDIEQHLATWKNSLFSDARAINIITKKGCPRTCSFCARVDKKIRSMSPEKTFKVYKELIEKYKINFIYEMGDTALINRKWLREYYKVYLRNKGLYYTNSNGIRKKVRFWFFADVRDLDEESIEILKDIGAKILLIGIESGSEELRAKNGKFFSNEKFKEIVKLLTKNNIYIQPSFIIGLIGENKDSLSKTEEILNFISKNGKVFEIGINLILPLPGSIIWKEMMKVPKLREKYFNEYLFNLDELRNDYLKHFCDSESIKIFLNHN